MNAKNEFLLAIDSQIVRILTLAISVLASKGILEMEEFVFRKVSYIYGSLFFIQHLIVSRYSLVFSVTYDHGQ